MAFGSFEDLDIWKRTRELKNDIFKLVQFFPPHEKYKLTDQLIRSSRSINSQIAEGHGRKTFPDRIRFCIIARGSLSETLNHLIDAYDCSYINEEILAYYRNKISNIERLLNGYISYLEKQSTLV
ncbi:MAG: four helix bundle protein [Flavisolibacter sp.]